MLNNITIRGGLTLVISVFVAFLLTVIGVGYGALKLANSSLAATHSSAVVLSHLKASSEKLLQVQLALGTYQTLFSVVKQTDDLLPAAQLDGITTTALTLDLEPMLLGMSPTGARYWTDRMLELRDTLGVFRLAYLEALIIAADWRASMEPKEVIE